MDKLKEILDALGIEAEGDELKPEAFENSILEKIQEKNNQITQLESERDTLSVSNQELSASVEGLKADKEKLGTELSETKGKYTQLSDMYKEQFSKDPDEPTPEPKKDEKELGNDVLAQILGK